LGLTRRQTYYLLQNHRIPSFKLGDDLWRLRPYALYRHYAALEAAAIATPEARKKAETAKAEQIPATGPKRRKRRSPRRKGEAAPSV
jgi:hypothetical protein